MRLLSSAGELVRGRCGATNLCDYCATLAAVENSELLMLDALAGNAPTMVAVLTTGRATVDARPFYRAREVVLRALRRRWPACEIAALVEFTTGYGPRSGGLRRPHWNLLIKGIPTDDVDLARDVVVRVWCGRRELQAQPQAQYLETIKSACGLIKYVAQHFQKASQAPPAGWTGHRFLKTRGYLSATTIEARAAARDSLAFKRALWRAIEAGRSATDAEIDAHAAMRHRAATSWRLLRATEVTEEGCRPMRAESRPWLLLKEGAL